MPSRRKTKSIGSRIGEATISKFRKLKKLSLCLMPLTVKHLTG